MTCIAGVVGDDGRVYIGGDSAGLSAWSIVPRADLKVFRRGEWVFGFTHSFRMGQLIRYSVEPPEPPKRDLDRFMATSFIDALRETLKDGGFAKVAGRGCRSMPSAPAGTRRAARSSVLHKATRLPPRKRVLLALEAAAEQNGAVCAPFTVVSA